tara:strand:+ start:809 stop:946 length:138 start_codon:yes stop_codon:yes gene_type:complete
MPGAVRMATRLDGASHKREGPSIKPQASSTEATSIKPQATSLIDL